MLIQAVRLSLSLSRGSLAGADLSRARCRAEPSRATPRQPPILAAIAILHPLPQSSSRPLKAPLCSARRGSARTVAGSRLDACSRCPCVHVINVMASWLLFFGCRRCRASRPRHRSPARGQMRRSRARAGSGLAGAGHSAGHAHPAGGRARRAASIEWRRDRTRIDSRLLLALLEDESALVFGRSQRHTLSSRREQGTKQNKNGARRLKFTPIRPPFK